MPKYNYYCDECEEYFEINKPKERKAGSLVEEYIKKNKEAVKEEKQKLKSKEYKP